MGQQRKKEMRQDMKRVLANLDKRWQAAAHVEVGRGVIDVIDREREFPITDVLAWVPSFAGEVDLAGVIAEMLKTRRSISKRVRMEFNNRKQDMGMVLMVRTSGAWLYWCPVSHSMPVVLA